MHVTIFDRNKYLFAFTITTKQVHRVQNSDEKNISVQWINNTTQSNTTRKLNSTLISNSNAS